MGQPDSGPQGWSGLSRHLDWAEGAWFAFAFGPAGPLATLRERALASVRQSGGEARTLTPGTPQALRQTIAELAHGDPAALVWLQAPCDDPPWIEAWDDVMLRANERRELLKRQLQGGLVFAASPTLKPRFREAAPDLWSARSLVLDLEQDSSDPDTPHQPDPRAARTNNWRIAEAVLRARFHRRMQRGPWHALVIGDDEVPRQRLLQALATECTVWVHSAWSEALLQPAACDAHWIAVGDDPPLGLVQALQADAIQQPLFIAGGSGLERSLDALPALADARAYTVRLYVERSLHPGPLPTLDREEEVLRDAWDALQRARAPADLMADLEGPAARQVDEQRLRDMSQAAEALLTQGWSAEAAPVVEELDELCLALAADQPDSTALMAWRAHAAELASRVAHALGDLAGARARQAAALALRRDLAIPLGPDHHQRRSQWAMALSVAGGLELHAGDLDEADGYLRHALRTREQLMGWSDDHETRSDLAMSWSLIGDLELARCDLGEARLDAAREAVVEARRLREVVATETGLPRHRRLLSVSWGRTGRVLARAGATRSARRAFTEAATLARALASEDPGRPALRMEASVAESMVGDAARSSGDWPAAHAAYAAAVSQRRHLVSEDPENARWQFLLAVAVGRRADAELALSRVPEARRTARWAVDVLEQLVWMDPEHPGWQRGLALAWIRRGDVALARGAHDRAARAWHRAQAVADALEALATAQGRRRALEVRSLLIARNRDRP